MFGPIHSRTSSVSTINHTPLHQELCGPSKNTQHCLLPCPEWELLGSQMRCQVSAKAVSFATINKAGNGLCIKSTICRRYLAACSNGHHSKATQGGNKLVRLVFHDITAAVLQLQELCAAQRPFCRSSTSWMHKIWSGTHG